MRLTVQEYHVTSYDSSEVLIVVRDDQVTVMVATALQDVQLGSHKKSHKDKNINDNGSQDHYFKL